MSFHYKRSTNERVLARHHLKRLPQVDPQFDDAVDTLGAVSSDSASIQTLPSPVLAHPADTLSAATIPVASRSASDVVSVLPPLATDKIPTSATPIASSDTILLPSSSSVSPTLTSSSSSALVQVSSSSSPKSLPTSASTSSHASPSPLPSTTSQSDAKNSGSASHGLSPGAVGGIVVVLLISVAAVIGFFVRRRFQQRRVIKRNTWGAGLVPALETKRDTVYSSQPYADQFTASTGGIPAHERLANVPKTTEMSQAPGANGIPGLTAPTSSYNPGSPPPTSPFVPSSIRAPSLKSVAPSTVGLGTPPFEVAIVARTFVPSLPDELHIANGEQIRVLTAYDDGWALCSNPRGEQGVVPLECLERSTAPTEMQLQPQSEFGSESNRTSRRLSSLMPNTAGTY